ncbi:MAG TPA: hypothetical protein V6D05_16860 [Stenomitos sp.]
MIRPQTLILPRPDSLDPGRLERAIAEAIAAPPLRWAIVAVEGDRLIVEVTA